MWAAGSSLPVASRVQLLACNPPCCWVSELPVGCVVELIKEKRGPRRQAGVLHVQMTNHMMSHVGTVGKELARLLAMHAMLTVMVGSWAKHISVCAQVVIGNGWRLR